MFEITSRNELREWLKDKPRECAQVVAARAALRVLPYAFQHSIAHDWIAKFALALFRANAISWAARNFPAHDMSDAAIRATDAATPAARTGISHAAHAAANAAYAAHSAIGTASAAANAAYAASRGNSRDAAWNNISVDCEWLDTASDRATAALRLTREPLRLRAAPKRWQSDWGTATARVLRLDPSYQVWIDWYNRRIKGEDAAFDIPGDINRTEDKGILIKQIGRASCRERV